MAYFLNAVLGTIVPMCVTALVTMAITMIFKTSSTTNFAQGVISAFGAYTVAACLNKANMSLWLALPIGIVVAVAIAVAVDVLIFRRGRYVNALGKQIITMGLISIVVGGIPLIFGAQTPQFKTFVTGNLSFLVGGKDVTVTKNALVCLAITVVVLAVIFLLLHFSRWGLSVRATAANEYVAGMLGINTHVITAISWGLAGALGTLAATMNAGINTVGVYFMTNYQVNAFLAGILGGFATFHGPIIAALLIPLANNLVVYLGNVMGVPELSGWSLVIVYGISLIVIFFKPQGLFGKKIVKKV
ncbi:MAG: branched-chain amino acid ABC transporter permease [Oscillospiraceae bacterium]|nr:branched-chain amino acid ABC transporter permease [Oscillospiraceae bacterium]